jgi:hypothetical protein
MTIACLTYALEFGEKMTQINNLNALGGQFTQGSPAGPFNLAASDPNLLNFIQLFTALAFPPVDTPTNEGTGIISEQKPGDAGNVSADISGTRQDLPVPVNFNPLLVEAQNSPQVDAQNSPQVDAQNSPQVDAKLGLARSVVQTTLNSPAPGDEPGSLFVADYESGVSGLDQAQLIPQSLSNRSVQSDDFSSSLPKKGLSEVDQALVVRVEAERPVGRSSSMPPGSSPDLVPREAAHRQLGDTGANDSFLQGLSSGGSNPLKPTARPEMDLATQRQPVQSVSIGFKDDVNASRSAVVNSDNSQTTKIAAVEMGSVFSEPLQSQQSPSQIQLGRQGQLATGQHDGIETRALPTEYSEQGARRVSAPLSTLVTPTGTVASKVSTGNVVSNDARSTLLGSLDTMNSTGVRVIPSADALVMSSVPNSKDSAMSLLAVDRISEENSVIENFQRMIFAPASSGERTPTDTQQRVTLLAANNAILSHPHQVRWDAPAVQVELVRMIRDGGGQVLIKMTPPDDSSFRIDLKMDSAGGATLVVDGASDSVRSRLEQGADQLKEQFLSLGFNLELSMTNQQNSAMAQSPNGATATDSEVAESSMIGDSVKDLKDREAILMRRAAIEGSSVLYKA